MKTDKRLDELLEACGGCGGEAPPSIGMAQQAHDDNKEEGESRMAKSDLFNIADNAKALHDMLDDSYPLEDWAKAKLTKASDYVKAVLQHIKYEVEQEGEQPEGQEHTKIYIATDPRTLGL